MPIFSFNKYRKKIKTHYLLLSLVRSFFNGEFLACLKFEAGLLNVGKQERCYAYRMMSGKYFYFTKNKWAALRYAKKSFQFSDTEDLITSHYIDVLASLGLTEKLREVYFEIGKRFAKNREILNCIKYFNLYRDVYANSGQGDKYIYDTNVVTIIGDLADKSKINVKNNIDLKKVTSITKTKIAHLVFGLKHKNSVIIDLISQMSKHGDHDTFENIFYISESSHENGPVELTNLAILKALGGRVYQASHEDKLVCLQEIAQAILDDEADVVVVTAILADYEQLYLISLLPDEVPIVGLCYGPLEQYYCNRLSLVIASDRRIASNIPIEVQVVPIEVGEFNSCPTKIIDLKKQYVIPEDACLMMSGGRPSKFLCKEWWQAIIKVLEDNKNCYFFYAGVASSPEFLAEIIPENLSKRIISLGWQEYLYDTLKNIDIYIDTFPSGGGVIVLMAQSLGKPILTFSEDESKKFDQNNWSPASNYVPSEDFIVPRWDFKVMRKKLNMLINDTDVRESYSERCRVKWLNDFSSPKRMIHRYEILINGLRRNGNA